MKNLSISMAVVAILLCLAGKTMAANEKAIPDGTGRTGAMSILGCDDATCTETRIMRVDSSGALVISATGTLFASTSIVFPFYPEDEFEYYPGPGGALPDQIPPDDNSYGCMPTTLVGAYPSMITFVNRSTGTPVFFNLNTVDPFVAGCSESLLPDFPNGIKIEAGESISFDDIKIETCWLCAPAEPIGTYAPADYSLVIGGVK